MNIIKFFDKLEDKIRKKLSHKPIVYGFVGGFGVVLFWRGVWHLADFTSTYYFSWNPGPSTINFAALEDAMASLIIGSVLLLMTGLFVSNFIGNEIIISGLKGEKKMAEKTEEDLKTEAGAIAEIQDSIRKISKQLDQLLKK